MPHRKKSSAARRAIARETPAREALDLIHDRRIIANLFATYFRTVCGRADCARARACRGPGAVCFERYREQLSGFLRELADDPDIFADPDIDGDPDLDDEEEGYAGGC